MNVQDQIFQLKVKEKKALENKELNLVIELREKRLLLELKTVQELKKDTKTTKLFNPSNHKHIKAIQMEKVGLDYIPLIKGAYNVLAGRGGSGKSAVALKSMLMWLKVNKDKSAVAFFTEDGISEIRERAITICRLSNLNQDLIERIHFISLDNDDRIKWVTTSRDGYEVHEEYINGVIEFCKENNVEYIILDPLKRFHRLNENSNDDMDVLVRDCFTKLAVETNSVLLVLHHSAKDASGGARGAGTITDSARMAWRIGRYYTKDNQTGELTETPEKKDKIKLDVIKDNMGIESLCDIRNNEDKSILNPLKGSEFNFNAAPIETPFEQPQEDNDFLNMVG